MITCPLITEDELGDTAEVESASTARGEDDEPGVCVASPE